mgnify:CR=1 FL=1
MVTFETMNELTLKVTCRGSDIIYTKAGAFIAGDSDRRNYRFEKVLLGPQGGQVPAYEGDDERRFDHILRKLRSARRSLPA